MKVTIDGKVCTAKPGQFIMAVAAENGISIPNLCHHAALPGQACCRLCIVEVRESKDGGAGGTATPQGGGTVVVSCTYPVKEGLQVATQSERIRSLRRTVLALLKEEAPAAEGALKAYCDEYAVPDYGLHFNVDPAGKCILCGLCSKACEELGNCAIQTTMRGIDKVVAPPFNEPPEACIGCAACARVCPTGAIECVLDTAGQGTRKIWGKTFELARCVACGKPYATTEELAWLKAKLLDTDLNLQYCPTCRPKASIVS